MGQLQNFSVILSLTGGTPILNYMLLKNSAISPSDILAILGAQVTLFAVSVLHCFQSYYLCLQSSDQTNYR